MHKPKSLLHINNYDVVFRYCYQTASANDTIKWQAIKFSPSQRREARFRVQARGEGH